MTLSAGELEVLHKGGAVPQTIDGHECVLVRKDVYERLRHPVYDDSPWTDDELEALAEATFDQLDCPQPIR
jgi:hypothetical protein